MLRSRWRGILSLCLLIATISIGCGAPRSVLPDCAIERPNEEVIDEQISEAVRASTGQKPLLPATYEYLKRLDRDLGLFGDDE